MLLSLVVLMTLGWAAPALAEGETAAAAVWTDKDDYAPGEIAQMFHLIRSDFYHELTRLDRFIAQV